MASPTSKGIPSAWETAVKSHLASLTPDQQVTFKAPSSAEDCVKIITASKRKRKTTKVLEVMNPLLGPLKRFENVIDVVIQTNGAMGSPIWGPLKLALMVAIDHLATLERLAIILQRIVASLERYSNYEILFRNHTNTQEAIGTLYADLLDLCARIVRFHARKSITAVFVSFDKEFQKVADNITHHSTQIDWAANAANIEEAKKAREIEEVERQGRIWADIQQWLSPSTAEDDFSQNLGRCMDGSCEWALSSPKTQDFLASQSSEILRIGGAPGSGKSTLAAFLANKITDANEANVLYFLCKGTDETKRHPFQVLRTMLSQLLVSDTSLYSCLPQIVRNEGESVAALSRYFSLALNKTSKPVYLVVDALDECNQSKELVRVLIDLLSSSRNTTFKLMATCRDDPELIEKFEPKLQELIISPHDVQDLISKYIHERVSSCKYISGTELGSRVHSEISKAADGLWLFARLMMDEIQRLPGPAAVERQLLNLPRGLSSLYQQIFSAMAIHLDSTELRLAQHVFLWVDLAAFVLVGKGKLDREVLDIVVQAAKNGEEVFDCLDLARKLCSPLIRLVENEYGRITIDFVHHTVAQFIYESSHGDIQELSLILKPQRLKQLHHGLTSVWYFTSSPKSTKLLDDLRRDPQMYTREYFEMAYGLWDAFFMSCIPDSLSDMEVSAISNLCDSMSEFLRSKACLKWAAHKGTESTIPAFKAYSLKRVQFFTDFCFVLHCTGPWSPLLENTEVLKMPEDFERRPIAMVIYKIGHDYINDWRDDASIYRQSITRLPYWSRDFAAQGRLFSRRAVSAELFHDMDRRDLTEIYGIKKLYMISSFRNFCEAEGGSIERLLERTGDRINNSHEPDMPTIHDAHQRMLG